MVATDHGLGFRPLYQQAIDLVRRKIADGEWPAGSVLPAETRLAQDFGVSVGTVRKALQHLVDERLVERRQGVGTFVAQVTAERSLFRFFKLMDRSGARVMPDNREIGRAVGPASAEERSKLDLRARSRVIRVDRLRLVAGNPVMTDQVVLPCARFPGLDRQSTALPTTLYDYFEARFGVKVLRVAEALSAIEADDQSAETLGVAVGTPLLQIDRTTYSFDDVPVEWRLSRLRTDEIRYLSELG